MICGKSNSVLSHGIIEIIVHKRPLTRHYRSNPKVAFWSKLSCCRNLSALLINYKNRCFVIKLHFSGNVVDKEAFSLTKYLCPNMKYQNQKEMKKDSIQYKAEHKSMNWTIYVEKTKKDGPFYVLLICVVSIKNIHLEQLDWLKNSV